MGKLFVKNNKGITLMELIVSLALFSIVFVVVLGLFSMGITAQRKVLALQDVQDNARAILEFMTKEIRMGVINNGTTSSINITRPGGEIVEYVFNGNDLVRTINGGGGVINSDDVIINGSFYVAGVGAADALEPKVTIALSVRGSGIKIEEQARIDLQTTLSQRILDL